MIDKNAKQVSRQLAVGHKLQSWSIDTIDRTISDQESRRMREIVSLDMVRLQE